MMIQNNISESQIIQTQTELQRSAAFNQPTHPIETAFHHADSNSNRVGDIARVVPGDMSLDILDLLELVAQLHNREADHPGIEAKRAADRGLHGSRRVEAHDKMVAVVVSGLVFRRGLGQLESAPIGVSADDASGAENLEAAVSGNSNMCQYRFSVRSRWMKGRIYARVGEAG